MKSQSCFDHFFKGAHLNAACIRESVDLTFFASTSFIWLTRLICLFPEIRLIGDFVEADVSSLYNWGALNYKDAMSKLMVSQKDLIASLRGIDESENSVVGIVVIIEFLALRGDEEMSDFNRRVDFDQVRFGRVWDV